MARLLRRPPVPRRAHAADVLDGGTAGSAEGDGPRDARARGRGEPASGLRRGGRQRPVRRASREVSQRGADVREVPRSRVPERVEGVLHRRGVRRGARAVGGHVQPSNGRRDRSRLGRGRRGGRRRGGGRGGGRGHLRRRPAAPRGDVRPSPRAPEDEHQVAVGDSLPARRRRRRRRDGIGEDRPSRRVSVRARTLRSVPAHAHRVPGDDAQAVAPRASRVGAEAELRHPPRERGERGLAHRGARIEETGAV
mmetsp:Transcript_4265/g.15012  ORF Transcript_4265/g.15012 Transcript_4265/m.15012 type:complete len:252 (-) Transcript_4265:1547-2302(-)